MSVVARIAMGFAIVRGFMLSVLTIPWLAQKLRRPEATESERSLAWMAGSRSILLGGALLVLCLESRREALSWTLLADGGLQVFDATLALALRKRSLAVLPALLCLLDGAAAVALMG